MPERPSDESVGTRAGTWYGERRLPVGRALALALGPLDLWLEHRGREWRVAHRRADDPLADRLELAERALDGEGEGGSDTGGGPAPGAERYRFATSRTDEAVDLRPRLADRPVLARPVPQLVVLPRDEVELFVSTPIWVSIELSAPAGTLIEVPSSRPSDTWFGSDTRSGSLCYASRTAARLLLESLPQRPHRAITPMRVRNGADDPLVLERVSVPAPNLSLWADPRGGLWTQPVLAARERSGAFAIAELGSAPPEEAAGGERVSGPRDPGAPTVLHRALQVLLG